MSIYKLTIRAWPGSPYWYYDLLLSGKRLRGSTGLRRAEYSKEEAYRHALIDLHIDGDEQPEPGEESIGWLRDYILRWARHEGRADKTIEAYEGAFRHFIGYLTAQYPVKDIQRITVIRFQEHLLANGLKPGSVNIYCRHLRAAFGRLVDDEILDRNPFRKFRTLHDGSESPRHLSLDEIKRFLASVQTEKNEAYRRLLYLYLFIGRRRCEVLDLHRNDVDLDQMIIRIENNKDRADRKQVLDLSQSPEFIRDSVRWFMERSNSDYPFKVCHKDTISRRAKKHFLAAGLSGDLKLHSLRHTFVSRALNQGVDIYKVKEWLGHSRVAVTEMYAHDRPEGGIDLNIDVNISE